VMRIKFDMAQKIIFSNSDTKDYYVEKILQWKIIGTDRRSSLHEECLQNIENEMNCLLFSYGLQNMYI
jgi:hypothetical protein